MRTDSIIRYCRNESAVAPSIFCVLILLMRIGASANEKFMKLILAIITINREIDSSRYMVLRLALFLLMAEKCVSVNGVSRIGLVLSNKFLILLSTFCNF